MRPQTGSPSASLRRVHVDVAGTVQGVGFRPFVFRLAHSLQLEGFVRNDAAGVAIEVQGDAREIDAFLVSLVEQAPRHARIASVTVADRPALAAGESFTVVPSVIASEATTSLPADLCTCGACLRELFDSSNRRYRYPFINCTACGPRFTIARGLPYDRATTTMASFTMCDECDAEYHDPRDRRFHAQPNACPRCGPRVSLVDAESHRPLRGVDAITEATRALASGAIVAVKGLGGYHLACRADDPEAVDRLRSRKQRDDKPFAVMVRGLRAARSLVQLNAFESALLRSSARPIVLLRRRPGDALAPSIAPGRAELGLMLPYTPLHHLLLAGVGAPLVMTSGNSSDEPIAYRDTDALERLSGIADLFLGHDRPIHTRCEDSVVRVVDIAGHRQTLFIRRSRGYVPAPLRLSSAVASPIIAVGGQLKNTSAVARHQQVVIGPHAGDLDDPLAFTAWAQGLGQLEELSGARATAIAHDLHPEYASTKYALLHDELAAVPVQHHHAHLAACLAEHGERGPALGLIFDGSGFGNDGTMWGGELLIGDLGAFERLGHLRAVRLPGGDRAVAEPWRMACSWLSDAHDSEPSLCTSLKDIVAPSEWSRVSRLSRSALSPLTTSVGRLLDACAALCGVRASVTYEGQAAIELEALARASDDDAAYPVDVIDDGESIVLDPRALVLAVERDVNASCSIRTIATRVHGGLVYAAALGAQKARDRSGVETVVLSGGVFQNLLLLESLARELARLEFRVLVPRRLPPNDGGLSYGQAAVAAWQRRADVSGHSRSGR